MKPLTIPPVVEDALQKGATLACSISGGKDSQAMLNTLARAHIEHRWPGQIYAIHAHLGRAEWPQTLTHCQAMCDRLGIPLTVVSRPQGDLVQEIRDRMDKLRTTAPPWPSATNRYCTSDQKRGQIQKALRAAPFPSPTNRYCTGHQKANQIDKALRSSPWPSPTQRYCTSDQKTSQLVKQHRGDQLIVAAMGLRAQESATRAQRRTLSIAGITAKALRQLMPEDALNQQQPDQRLAFDWLPIHDWNPEDVWHAIGTSTADLWRRQELYKGGAVDEALDQWPAHPAYVFGNRRLSCALCILANKDDLRNGAIHNPGLYQEYLQIEQESGFSFRHGFSLRDLFVTTPPKDQLPLFPDSATDRCVL